MADASIGDTAALDLAFFITPHLGVTSTSTVK